MQLFITEFKQTGNNIILQNTDILEQTRKVLRMKIGDKFFIQNGNTRHEIKIIDRDKTSIKGEILDTKEYKKEQKIKRYIAIAMPNKRSKAELIIQKLSEIGIDNIYFRQSERSIIKDFNQKKIERLYKISKEAVEQSRGRNIPKIEFIKDISNIIKDKQIFIFDKSDTVIHLQKETLQAKKDIVGVIGPEGGLTANDYQKFGKDYKIISLGETILRTETASIIAGWKLKNID